MSSIRVLLAYATSGVVNFKVGGARRAMDTQQLLQKVRDVQCCTVAVLYLSVQVALLVRPVKSKDFVNLCDNIARQRAYAYNEHFNSSVNMTMSMFKLSITSRWALMAARGWARLILDRRRDSINDRPNCATATEAPLDEAKERYQFDNPTAHTHGAYQHSEAA